jgi:hypothetical protein
MWCYISVQVAERTSIKHVFITSRRTPPVGNQPLPGFSTISIGRQWSKERNVQRYLKNFKDLLNYGNEEASQIMMGVCICVSFIPVSDASRPVYDCWVVLQMCIQATWIGKWFHPTNLGQTIPGVTNNISASDAFHGFDLERANTHIHPLICASRGLWSLFSLK